MWSSKDGALTLLRGLGLKGEGLEFRFRVENLGFRV